eukprot:TRINITY_DN8996_c0_g1_i1.p1 TRINITY_DN8996_c0_g1~~TRINITY_DN8996_c0_g1_i1.p1  ORF type:complete len:293 (-),score=57.84 TRINITY_DN8996_c0_g1_i1:374-1252(-)
MSEGAPPSCPPAAGGPPPGVGGVAPPAGGSLPPPPLGPPPSGPAAIIAPGNYDKAWNDPPLFSYTESTVQHTGNRLNKRVGFPSAQLSNPPKPGTVGTSLPDAGAKPAASNIAPPPPRLHDAGCRPLPDAMVAPPPAALGTSASLPPPPPPAMAAAQSSADSKGSVGHIDGLSRSEICDKMRQLANDTCGDKAMDIIKRLKYLEKSFENPNLNPRIIKILGDYCISLENESLTEADRLLTTLSVDYAGDCAQWIIALRHILTAKQSQAPKKEETSANPAVFMPFMMPAPTTQ